MRVQVVDALPQPEKSPKEFTDIAVERALKNFYAAVETDDSLFTAEQLRVTIADADPPEKACVGTFALSFKSESHAHNKGLHFSLIEKLTELLRNAGSAESLAAQLALSSQSASVGQSELTIQLNLEARGNSPEQAGLRWGLGLAHVQQALLFASRQIRQLVGPAAE